MKDRDVKKVIKQAFEKRVGDLITADTMTDLKTDIHERIHRIDSTLGVIAVSVKDLVSQTFEVEIAKLYTVEVNGADIRF